MQAPVVQARPLQAAPLARPAPPQIRPQPIVPQLGSARPVQPAPAGPITDVNGNRMGARPVVGPASPAQVHAALQANDAAVARAPRPQAPVVQAGPAAQENPTRNLGALNAAQTIQNQKYATEKAIDEQSR